MGHIVKKTVLIIFLLILAAGVAYPFYRMFVKPIVSPSDLTPKPVDVSGISASDTPRPSFASQNVPTPPPSELAPTATPAPPKAIRRISGMAMDYDMKAPVTDLSLVLLGQETDFFASVDTAADGSFAFGDIPEDAGDSFIVRASGNQYYMADVPAGIGDKLALMPVKASVLQGVVNDSATMLGIRGAKVQAIVFWDNREINFYTTSDFRGDYNISPAPPGQVVSVVVFAPGYVPDEHIRAGTILRLVRGSAVRHNVSCVPGAVLTGKVVDEKGDPIAGALVFLAPSAGDLMGRRAVELRDLYNYITFTDEQGKFEMYPAPVDSAEYTVVVYREKSKVKRTALKDGITEIVLSEGDDPHPLFQ